MILSQFQAGCTEVIMNVSVMIIIVIIKVIVIIVVILTFVQTKYKSKHFRWLSYVIFSASS